MTAYLVSGLPQSTSAGVTTSTYQLAVRAGTLPVRIIKIEPQTGAIFSPTGAMLFQLTRRSGVSMSGGAGAITPIPLREGAQAASATCRYGTVDVDGTPPYPTTPITFTAGTAVSLREQSGGGADYQFPVDYIMSPGSAFVVQSAAFTAPATASACFLSIVIYFEEIPLSRSF